MTAYHDEPIAPKHYKDNIENSNGERDFTIHGRDLRCVLDILRAEADVPECFDQTAKRAIKLLGLKSTAGIDPLKERLSYVPKPGQPCLLLSARMEKQQWQIFKSDVILEVNKRNRAGDVEVWTKERGCGWWVYQPKDSGTRNPETGCKPVKGDTVAVLIDGYYRDIATGDRVTPLILPQDQELHPWVIGC